MALVQGLVHFVLIALGTTFRHLDVDLKQLEEFATPTFRNILDLTRRHLSQDAILYACIQLQNQANLSVITAFEEVVLQMLKHIHNRDATGLVALLNKTRGWVCGGED
jgi:prephenate dehydrogenase